MTNLVAPIYTGTLNGKPLRFFRAPYADVHLPWHDFSELLICCGTDPALATQLANFTREEHPEAIKTVTVGSSICLIAAHYVAKVFIEELALARRIPRKSILVYQILTVDAWESAYGEACTDKFFSAWNNTNRACEGCIS